MPTQGRPQKTRRRSVATPRARCLARKSYSSAAARYHPGREAGGCNDASCRLVASTTRNRAPAACDGVLLLLAAFGPVGCKLFDSTCGEDDRTCLGGGQSRSGQACIRNGDCAVGLSCKANVCDYVGTTKRGNACVATPECADGLYCSPIDLQCRPLNPDAQQEAARAAPRPTARAAWCAMSTWRSCSTKARYSQISDDCRMQQQRGHHQRSMQTAADVHEPRHGRHRRRVQDQRRLRRRLVLRARSAQYRRRTSATAARSCRSSR